MFLSPPSARTSTSWRPPERVASNRPQLVDRLRVHHVGPVGPAAVLVLADGAVLTGCADGRLQRLDPGAETVTTVADTGGRPLGLEHHPQGGVVVCDAERGLLLLREGELSVLCDEVLGAPLTSCDDAAVATDGTIFFTTARQGAAGGDAVDEWWTELIEHVPTGRLLRRDPNGTVTVLLDDLAHAGGVALAADERSVVVAETAGYGLRRCWIAGPRAGEVEPFGPVLDGLPRRLSTDDDGRIWVALAMDRCAVVDRVQGWGRVGRRVGAALPPAWRPQPVSAIHVQAYDADGALCHDLRGFHPDFGTVTGVRRDGDHVWVGTGSSGAVARFASPA